MAARRYGTAHNGLGDWYVQRLSAVLVALLLPLAFALLMGVYDGSLDQAQMLHLIDGYVGRMLHSMLLIGMLAHAYLGVKVIVEDYLHTAAVRIPLMSSLLIGIAGFGIWWLSVIWAWGS